MGSRSQRGSLSRHAVLDAALALIDRDGLDGLTVRRLAAELGRPPMTLYAHFASKRALLDLGFEHLLRRLLRGHAYPTWRGELEAACRHMRRELLEHPHWVSLLTRVHVPLSALRVYDHLLDRMWDDGFRPEAAMFGLSSILGHALGSVLTERMMHGSPPIPKQRLELVKRILAEAPRGSYRRVVATAPRFDDWSFDRVFEVGLQSLLTGLDESAPRRKGYRRPTRQGA